MIWFMLGIVLGVIGKIWFLVIASRKSLGWGLACAFIPGVWLIFLYLHFSEGRAPALTLLIGFILGLLGVGDVVATLKANANPYVRVYHSTDPEEIGQLLPLLRGKGLTVIYATGGDIVVRSGQELEAQRLIDAYRKEHAPESVAPPVDESPLEREDRRLRESGIIRDPDYRVVASVLCGPTTQIDLNGKDQGATISPPIGIAVKPDGTVVFGTTDGRIYRVLPNRSLEIIAVIGPPMLAKDGRRMDAPTDLFADAIGTVHISTYFGGGLARIAPDGAVEMRTLTLESEEMTKQLRDYFPSFLSITGDDTGTVLVSTTTAILRVDPQGLIRPQSIKKVPAERELMANAMAMTTNGDLICGNIGDRTIRRINPKGVTTIIAGTGEPGTVDGPIAEARFETAQDIAVHPDGDIFVLEEGDVIRRITPQGNVTTLTSRNMSIDYRNPGLLKMEGPYSHLSRMALAPDKTIYVTDSGNHVIWKLDLIPRAEER